MTKKDVTITENCDREHKNSDAALPGEKSDPALKEKETTSDNVKNASATGDGSFGRSESSLPEEEEGGMVPKTNSPY